MDALAALIFGTLVLAGAVTVAMLWWGNSQTEAQHGVRLIVLFAVIILGVGGCSTNFLIQATDCDDDDYSCVDY